MEPAAQCRRQIRKPKVSIKYGEGKTSGMQDAMKCRREAPN